MTTIEGLRRLSLCANFSPEALLELSEFCRLRRFASGTWLLRQGEVGQAAYAILSGRVAVLRSLPGGGELALAEVGPGGLVGELGLLADLHRISSTRALSEVSTLVFDRTVLLAGYRLGRPVVRDLLWAVLQGICAQLRKLTGELQQVLPPAAPWSPAPLMPEPAFDYAPFLPLLPGAPAWGPAGLQTLAARGVARTYAAGEVVFAATSSAAGVALVVRGAVETVALAGAPTVALQVFGPGALCGVPAVLDHGQQGVEFRAREGSLLLALAQSEFDSAWVARDDFAASLHMAVAEQLADSVLRLVNRLAQQVGLQRAQANLGHAH